MTKQPLNSFNHHFMRSMALSAVQRSFIRDLLVCTRRKKIEHTEAGSLFRTYSQAQQKDLIIAMSRSACDGSLSGKAMMARDLLAHIVRESPEHAVTALEVVGSAICVVKKREVVFRTAGEILKSCPQEITQEWTDLSASVAAEDWDLKVRKAARWVRDICKKTKVSWVPTHPLPQIKKEDLKSYFLAS